MRWLRNPHPTPLPILGLLYAALGVKYEALSVSEYLPRGGAVIKYFDLIDV